MALRRPEPVLFRCLNGIRLMSMEKFLPHAFVARGHLHVEKNLERLPPTPGLIFPEKKGPPPQERPSPNPP